MINKRYIWAIALILAALIIGACGTIALELVTGIASPVIPEPVVDAPEWDATMDRPTQTPELVSTPDLEEAYPGWSSYTNPDYGFAFRYPSSWKLEEEANVVKLSRGSLLLAIFFQRQGADARPPWTGMPAGAFERKDAPAFMGQEIDGHALIYEGKVKVLTYGAEVGDVFYAIRLDDMTTADYQSIDITEDIEDEVDRIVGSFFLPESGGL